MLSCDGIRVVGRRDCALSAADHKCTACWSAPDGRNAGSPCVLRAEVT